MKRTITRIALALTLFCGAGTVNNAKAQFAVEDFMNLAQNLIFFIQDTFDTATQIGNLCEQVGVAKDTYQKLRDMYNTVDKWIQNTHQVTSLINRTAYAYNSLNYYGEYIQRLGREGHITPYKIRYLASSASSILNTIKSIEKDAQQIFKGDNSLTKKERMDLASESDEQMQSYLDTIQAQILATIKVQEEQEFSNNTANGLAVLGII